MFSRNYDWIIVMRAQQGFTLIELMIVLMLIAVMAGIGVPAFQTMLQNSRLTSSTNSLLSALQYARSEAVTQRSAVTISPLNGSGEIFFNTYEPSMAAGQCKASVGLNRSYAMKLEDAAPISTAVGSNSTHSDRYNSSTSQGISGDPQLFCQGDDCFVLPDPSLPPLKAKVPPLGALYWSDSLNSD